MPPLSFNEDGADQKSGVSREKLLRQLEETIETLERMLKHFKKIRDDRANPSTPRKLKTSSQLKELDSQWRDGRDGEGGNEDGGNRSEDEVMVEREPSHAESTAQYAMEQPNDDNVSMVEAGHGLSINRFSFTGTDVTTERGNDRLERTEATTLTSADEVLKRSFIPGRVRKPGATIRTARKGVTKTVMKKGRNMKRKGDVGEGSDFLSARESVLKDVSPKRRKFEELVLRPAVKAPMQIGQEEEEKENEEREGAELERELL